MKSVEERLKADAVAYNAGFEDGYLFAQRKLNESGAYIPADWLLENGGKELVEKWKKSNEGSTERRGFKKNR